MKQVNQGLCGRWYFLEISVFCHSKPQDGALMFTMAGGGGGIGLFNLLYNIWLRK